MMEATEHTDAVNCVAMPDYETPCENCGHKPTVVLINPKTLQVVHHTLLCGCCCWGEAACLDPDNW